MPETIKEIVPPWSAAKWQQVASWLAATDIECVEFSAPGLELRLIRGDSGYRLEENPLDLKPAPCLQTAKAPKSSSIIIKAPCAGIFLERHPMRSSQLVASGERVQAGDIVGLLQLGHVLAPVLAPVGGVIVGAMAVSGVLVGYGTPLIEIDPGEA